MKKKIISAIWYGLGSQIPFVILLFLYNREITSIPTGMLIACLSIIPFTSYFGFKDGCMILDYQSNNKDKYINASKISIFIVLKAVVYGAPIIAIVFSFLWIDKSMSLIAGFILTILFMLVGIVVFSWLIFFVAIVLGVSLLQIKLIYSRL